MKIKKGDKVIVVAGSDKGKVGEVLSVSLKSLKVTVAGVNVKTKHNKPTQANPEGSITNKEAGVDVSNVAFYDEKAKKATKIGYKVVDGKKERFMKSNGELCNKASKKAASKKK